MVMKGKMITIGIMGMFLLINASVVIAVSTTSVENSKDKNGQIGACGMDERCAGYMWTTSGTDGDVLHIEPNSEFGGPDRTIYVPHGEGVSLWADWEIKEDSWLLYPETWGFQIETNYIQIEDQLAYDDAQAGTLYWNFSSEYLKAHPEGFGLQVFLEVRYKPPLLDWGWEDTVVPSDGVCKIIPENEPPNTPAVPDGPTTVKHESTHTYTVEASDPDGDPIVEYNWFVQYGDDNHYHEVKTTTEPKVDITFRDSSWGRLVHYLKVQVKDDYGAWSEWSEPLKITSKKLLSRNACASPFWEFLEHFPSLERLLQSLR